MKKLFTPSFLLPAIFILFSNSIFSQTVVSGNITGTWTPVGSPYIVNGDVFVVGSLIVLPGTTVKFNAGGFKIEVGSDDKLFARGTQNEPIIFEPYVGNNSGSWNSIYLNTSGADDTLEYCIIKYAAMGIWGFDSAPIISNCTIFGCSEFGINLGYFHNVGIPKISFCKIYENQNGITFRPYDKDGQIQVDAQIYKCNIYDNAINGIWISVGTYWNWGYAYGNAKITNCTIFNNKTGVRAYANRGNADATITNSIFAFNKEYGVVNEGGGIVGPDDITYDCLWGNKLANFYNLASKVGFGQNGSYTNANGDACDINFNIYYDPFLVDTLNSDFSLKAESNCIDAGNSIIYDKFFKDTDGTIPEIGSYFFEQKPTSVIDLEYSNTPALLLQNYPNPFYSTTSIRYHLNSNSHVQIIIYDISGRILKTLVNQSQTEGEYSVSFDASGLERGIYIFKLRADSFEQSHKMLLLR